MKNTILDLNNYLFEQLERMNDDDLTDDALDRQLRKTDSIIRISESIIKNGELALKAAKLASDTYDDNLVPKMLLSK